MHILIIEDDPWLAANIQRELSRNYSIDTVGNGRDGLYHGATNQYDVIVLDIGLPDLSGFEVCRRLREQGVSCPVLILTGNKRIEDTVEALNAGADDYLTKPFNFLELKARLTALLRRGPNRLVNSTLSCDDLELDIVNRIVRRRGTTVQLRRKEHDLLELLLRHKGAVVSRDMILEHVWDTSANTFTNAIDVHIKHLRDKIDRPYGSHLIQTIYGFGYRIGDPPPEKLCALPLERKAI
jgi:two-component system OmpR family response regulator